MKIESDSSLNRLLRLVVLVVGLGFLARAGTHWISHNYNLAAEANGLYGILEVSDGKKLYPPREQKPYHVYLYPPLHAWVSAGLLKGLGIESLRARVLWVRALSLVAFGLLGWMLYRFFLTRMEIAPWMSFAILALAAPKFADYATTSRNDMFACVLEMGAVCAFLVWIETRASAKLVLWLGLCFASILTRQTGVVALLAGLSWLWLTGERRRASLCAIGVAIALGFAAWLLQWKTGGAFYEQVVLANVRSFRPVNFKFFDLSLLSFFVCYLAFAVLTWLGLKSMPAVWAEGRSRLMILGFFWSVVISSLLFLRAGGDVNYFFPVILFAVPWAGIGLVQLLGTAARLPVARILLAQAVAIAIICILKAGMAWQDAHLPYERVAERLMREQPEFGFLLGKHAQNMGIHLRGWAIHGPDVTNAGDIAHNGHAELRWIIRDLKRMVENGRVSVLAVFDPHCVTRGKRFQMGYFRGFESKECWEDWFCFFRRPSEAREFAELQSGDYFSSWDQL